MYKFYMKEKGLAYKERSDVKMLLLWQKEGDDESRMQTKDYKGLDTKGYFFSHKFSCIYFHLVLFLKLTINKRFFFEVVQH